MVQVFFYWKMNSYRKCCGKIITYQYFVLFFITVIPLFIIVIWPAIFKRRLHSGFSLNISTSVCSHTMYIGIHDTCALKMQGLAEMPMSEMHALFLNVKKRINCYVFNSKMNFYSLPYLLETKSKLNYSWLESTSQITLTLEPLIMVKTSEPVKYLVHSPTSMSHPWSEGWSMVCLGFLTDRTVSSKSDLES